MSELLEASLSVVNILPTALLTFMVIYWVMVILGLLDLDFLDFDIEIEEINTDGIFSVAALNHLLAFFNLGKIPLMIFFSFLVLPLWYISVISNYYLGNSSFILSLVLLIPNFIISLFIAKFLTLPFVKVFSKLDRHKDSSVSIIGQMCTVVIETNGSGRGQAQIKTEGAPLLISTITKEGVILKKGATAIVIDYNEITKDFLLEPFEVLV